MDENNQIVPLSYVEVSSFFSFALLSTSFIKNAQHNMSC